MQRTEAATAAVARAAMHSGRTVAVAESLTSGAVISALGKGESAEDWLKGGVVAYHMEVKTGVLGVPEGTDPCSAECAIRLAQGVRDLLGSDVAVATTGVGGPEPDGGHPAGTVHLGWCSGARSGHVLLQIPGSPEDVVRRTVEEAIETLASLLPGGGPAGAPEGDPARS